MTEKTEKDMVIYLPGGEPRPPEPEPLPSFDELTPREIVVELDKYIVGQNAAKKAVAIALRNRVRRQKLPPEVAEDILPKNILMIGPTGVGKTEVARRLARLAGCPFVKVEASKYTEVGYVGRDVESMVRDLVETAIDMVREEKLDEVAERAEQSAEDRLLDLLLPPSPIPSDTTPASEIQRREQVARTREKLRAQLREGKLDTRMVEVEVRERQMPSFEIITNQGVEEMDINVKDMLSGMFGQQKKKRKMTVAEAFDQVIKRFGDRHFALLFLLAEHAGEHVLYVDVHFLDALIGDDFEGGHLAFADFDFDHARVELAFAQLCAKFFPRAGYLLAALNFEGGRSRSSRRSSADCSARSATSSSFSSRTMSIAVSTRSRTMDSTSRPTYPTSLYFDASTLMNAQPVRRARPRGISVFPPPVGPIIRMFFGRISSASSGVSF